MTGGHGLQLCALVEAQIFNENVYARTNEELIAECAKRWQFRLDPKLDHREWTVQEDELLLRYGTLLRRSLSEESASDSAKDHTYSSPADSAEPPVPSAPGPLTNDPTLSQCLNLDGASPMRPANEQCQDDPSHHDYDGELDLDMDFYSDANLFDPSPQPSDRADDMGTEISDSNRSGSVPLLHLSPVIDPSLDLDPASLCGYGGDVSRSTLPNQLSVASAGCSIFEAPPAQLDIGRAALSDSLSGLDSLNRLNMHATGVMPTVVERDSSDCGGGIGSAVSRVVLVVEECDPDMVNYLIDITGRLKGKVKMEMTI
ncbi:hypothetical protein NLG97_g1686 [Lecanicillium saksenae]|uniref:Uncharacterized protein n=1 Tax=Lecanicillium saksenae TaxID=468837 RepID=A0ACC1R6H3_9HYPO|nr:hypothetical protein NLG97_g1686 [Lecanicillium saksenae]